MFVSEMVLTRRLFCLTGLVLFLGCKHNPVDPGGNLTSVDFRLGNHEVYEWTISEFDSAGVAVVQYRDTFVVTVAAFGETLGTMTDLLRINAYQIRSPSETTSVWYRTSSTELTEVAYFAAGRVPVVTPKRQGRSGLGPGFAPGPSVLEVPYTVQRRLGYLHEISDSVIFREDPRIVYKFPLVVGSSWTSFESPFLQTREVTDYTPVSVRGGASVCAAILTRLPTMDPNLEWFDYVCDRGILLREIHLSLYTTTLNSPEPVDSVRVLERLELLSRSTD